MQLRNRISDILIWFMVVASLMMMIYNTSINYARKPLSATPEIEIEPGTDLAGFRLTATNGEEFIIPAEGRYLISFLTTGCGACQQQIPILNEISGREHYRQVLGVLFEPVGKITEFESAFKPKFRCLIDSEGDLAGVLRLTVFPQTVEIDDGKVTHSWSGLQREFK